MAGPGIDVPGPALLADPRLLERTLADLSSAQLDALWETTGRTLVACGATPGSARRPARWAGEVVALRGAVLERLERRERFRPRAARRRAGVTRATSF